MSTEPHGYVKEVGKIGGIKQDVLLGCRRQMAAALGEAQTVGLLHSWHRANSRRALPQHLGRSLLFFSSFHTSNHAFPPHTLKQEQGTASMPSTSGEVELVRV